MRIRYDFAYVQQALDATENYENRHIVLWGARLDHTRPAIHVSIAD